MESIGFPTLLQCRKKALTANVTSSKMSNSSAPLRPAETETWRAKRRRGARVNPAANVKIVARMKSMGDGWSLWVGSAMVAVTQRRGWG